MEDDEEDMDPTQYFENRLKVLAALKSSGVNPYPHKFHVSLSLPEYINKYENLNSGEHLKDVEVSLAGRIMSKRSSGAKLDFYDLHSDGAKVQVTADAGNSGMEEAEFIRHLKHMETPQNMVLFFIPLLLGGPLLEIKGVYLITWQMVMCLNLKVSGFVLLNIFFLQLCSFISFC